MSPFDLDPETNGFLLQTMPNVSSTPTAPPNFDPSSGQPWLKRLGYALEGFGAGMSGRESLYSRDRKKMIEEYHLGQQNKRLELDTFKTTYGMFDEAFKVLRKLPRDKRQNAIGVLAGQMDTVSKGAGAAFQAYAQFGDTDLEEVMMQMFGDRATVNALMNVTGGDEERFYKLIANKEFMENVQSNVDRKNLGTAYEKMGRLIRTPEDQIPEQIRSRIKRDKDGSVHLDMALLGEANAALAPDEQLTTGELKAIERHPERFVGLGFITPKMAEAVAQKNLTKERWGEPYQLAGKTVQKNEDTGQIREIGSMNINTKVDMREDQTFENERKLRESFETKSKKFINLRDYFVPVARFMESEGKKGKEPPSTTDLQLVYAYLQTLDPKDDRVSEGDFRRLSALKSIPESIGTAIQSVFTGYNLPTDVRREMYSTVARAFKEANRTQRKLEESEASLAHEYPGISPKRVVRQYSINEKGQGPLSFPGPRGEQPGVPSVEQIESEGKKNDWDEATIEKTIRDMHGEAGVRRWREKRSDQRMGR